MKARKIDLTTFSAWGLAFAVAAFAFCMYMACYFWSVDRFYLTAKAMIDVVPSGGRLEPMYSPNSWMKRQFFGPAHWFDKRIRPEYWDHDAYVREQMERRRKVRQIKPTISDWKPEPNESD